MRTRIFLLTFILALNAHRVHSVTYCGQNLGLPDGAFATRSLTLSNCFAPADLSIPTEIGLYRELTSLSLDRGNVEFVPTEVGLLAKLRFLRIQSTQITEFPTEIGNLQLLFSFEAGNNQLRELPTEIGNFGTVFILNVQSNQLKELPTEIGQAQLLNSFLRGNPSLQSLPTEIGNMGPNVEYITCEGCNLTEIPTEIGQLGSMTLLELTRNRIGTIPSEVGMLTGLVRLRMPKNEFVGAIPSEFGGMGRLTVLELTSNQLTGIPSEIGRMESLRILDAGRNSIGSLPSEVGLLSRLEFMSLSESSIGVVPQAIEDLTALVQVELGSVTCDCNLSTWFPTFLDSSGVGSASVAVCDASNTFEGFLPQTITPETNAPCGNNRISSALPTERGVTIEWTYPQLSIEFNLDDFGAFTGKFFADAGAAEREIRNQLSSAEALASFQNCESLFAEVTSEYERLAYEVDIRDATTSTTVELKCFLSKTLAVTVPTSQNDLDGVVFRYSAIGLSPVTSYEIRITPFVLLVRDSRGISKTVGTTVKWLTKTLVDVPDGPPLNFGANSRGGDNVALQWSNPAENLRNGEIIEFQVEVQLETETRLETTPQNTLVVSGLSPSSDYAFRVQARTQATGFGPFSSTLQLTTCQTNAEAVGNTGLCTAVSGFFLRDSGVAASCDEVSNSVGQLACNQAKDVEEFELLPGFARITTATSDIRSCPIQDACVGGNGTGQCLPGFTGPLCAVCEDNFFRMYGRCVSCNPQEQSLQNSGTFIAGLVFWGVIFVVVCMCAGFKLSKAKKNIDSEAEDVDRKVDAIQLIAGLVRELVTTYQIISTFSWTLGVPLTPVFAETLQFFAVFSFQLFAQPCLDMAKNFEAEYWFLLIFYAFVMGMLFAILTLIKQYCTSTSDSKNTEVLGSNDGGNGQRCKCNYEALRAFILANFLFYTPLTNKATQAIIDCDTFTTNESFMFADYGTSCDSESYSRTFNVLAPITLTWAVGIPFLYGVILCRNKDDIANYDDKAGEENTDFLRAIEPLFLPYKDDVRYWEVVEIMRKIVFISCVAAFPTGSPEQSIFLVVAALLSAYTYQTKQPFKDDFGNMFAVAGSYIILMVSLSSLIIQLDSTYATSGTLDLLQTALLCFPFFVAIYHIDAIHIKVDGFCKYVGLCAPNKEQAEDPSGLLLSHEPEI